RVLRLDGQRIRRALRPVPAGQQEPEQLGAARVSMRRSGRGAVSDPFSELLERGACPAGPGQQAFSTGLVDLLDRDPSADAVAKEPRCALALPHTFGAPLVRHAPIDRQTCAL